MLHHSRHVIEDRMWLDERLLSASFGPRGKRGWIIAFTTQTAEQSLNIDRTNC
jgi:hypothetical protein